MDFRCPKCRDCDPCKKGDQFEKISIKQEQEQHLIKESIWIDEVKKRAVAMLPFRVDPTKYLTNNRGVAAKMLEKVCERYFKDKPVVEMVEKAFKKLMTNGHLLLWEDVSEEDKMILRRATVSYWIPWDINFSGSISTPARPTFNASKNTPQGTNLNDIIVRGVPNLVNLLHMDGRARSDLRRHNTILQCCFASSRAPSISKILVQGRPGSKS